jgi:low temperature requirement protein LtrA
MGCCFRSWEIRLMVMVYSFQFSRGILLPPFHFFLFRNTSLADFRNLEDFGSLGTLAGIFEEPGGVMKGKSVTLLLLMVICPDKILKRVYVK